MKFIVMILLLIMGCTEEKRVITKVSKKRVEKKDKWILDIAKTAISRHG